MPPNPWKQVGTQSIIDLLITKMGLSYADAARSCREADLFFSVVSTTKKEPLEVQGDPDIIKAYHEDGPRTCPKCGEPYVTEGTTIREREPVWVCDRQACGVVVAWRKT